MKRVTASEARQNWFRLLDEVVAGESVVIERHGVRVVLSREAARDAAGDEAQDYTALLSGAEIDQAERWGWEWNADGELEPVDGPTPTS